MSNGKATIIRLMVRLINKMQCSSYIKLGEYLPKPYGSFGGDISVKLDFSNYR